MFFKFRETLEHVNVSFNDNVTMSYSIKRSYEFIREKSKGDPETDVLVTTNLVLLCGSTIASEFSSFAALGLATLVKSIKSRPIINLTVHEYLFGYEDKLSILGSKILPSMIAIEKFGFLDQIIKGN